MKRVKRWVCCVTLIALLAGAVPSYATVSSGVAKGNVGDSDSSVTVSSRVATDSSTKTTLNETDDYTVLTLGTVVDLARRHHPEVIRADEALKAAERDLASRQAAFALTASASSTPLSLTLRDEQMRTAPGTLSLSANKSSPSGLTTSASVSFRVSATEPSVQVPSWNVRVSYPLFRSAELNSNNMAVRQAQIALETALANRKQAETTAVIDAVQRYHAAVTATTRLHQAKNTLSETVDYTESIRHRFSLGMVSEIERINAESELRRQELAHVQAQRTYNERLRSLLAVIGQDVSGEEIQLAPLPPLSLPVLDLDRDAWLTLARPHDITLWQREIAVETAELQLQSEIERNRLEANVSAGVSRGSQSQDTSPPRDEGTSPNWSVQVSLSYPLADGGARKRALEDREASLLETRKSLADELVAFEQRMAQRFDALDDAYINAELAELTYHRAQIEWTGAQAGYERGFTGESDLNRARRTLEQAYDEWQGAILDVWIAWWDLQSTVGLSPELSELITEDEA